MIFRYVIHDRVLDYARLGWCIADTFEHICHGEYSVLMVWFCDCPYVEPLNAAPLPMTMGAPTTTQRVLR